MEVILWNTKMDKRLHCLSSVLAIGRFILDHFWSPWQFSTPFSYSLLFQCLGQISPLGIEKLHGCLRWTQSQYVRNCDFYGFRSGTSEWRKPVVWTVTAQLCQEYLWWTDVPFKWCIVSSIQSESYFLSWHVRSTTFFKSVIGKQIQKRGTQPKDRLNSRNDHSWPERQIGLGMQEWSLRVMNKES